VDVQVKGSGPQRKVRVIVDRKGGVGIDACEELSRALSSRLDAENPIDSGYSLEVTSPGVHQRLDGRRAFDRVEGRAVLIHHDDPRGDRRQLEGVVHRADEAEVVIEVEGEQVRVPYEEIAKATQRLPW
jgi:ribosome maturation factor RimP